MLDPLKHVLSTLLSSTHDLVTQLGAAPGGAVGWCLSIAAIVVVVRSLLLPITVHTVRNARRSAHARPQLQEIARRYRGRTDTDSLRAMMEERRAVSAEHGVSRLGCLPVLLQLPLWFALYHLLADVAAGTPVGSMDAEQVALFDRAQLFGVGLADSGLLGQGGVHLAVVLGLAAVAALVSFATQHLFVMPNTPTEGMPEAMQQATRLMPTLSAVGLLAAGAFVPVGLLVYWVASQAWTLGQSFVVWRWFPTPGSRAAARREPTTAG
jgi:YidC/Oxa1 family membrane protein insertase